MGQARVNRRRAKQAAQNFNHLAPKQRPNYKRRDASAAQKHLERVVQREHERQQRKGAKK